MFPELPTTPVMPATMSDDFWTPSPDAPDKLDTARGFTPPTEATPHNNLKLEKRIKSEFAKLDKKQLEAIGPSAYQDVPFWDEYLVLIKAEARTEYYCKDHEKDPLEIRAQCPLCLEAFRLRKACAQIQFQCDDRVGSSNSGKMHTLFARIFWGVNDLTEDQLKVKRLDDPAKDIMGLFRMSRTNRRLLENMLIALGRESMLIEKAKLRSFPQVKWDILAEPGLNLVKARFRCEKRGEYENAEIVNFEKVS